MPAPIPYDAPVTTATFPASFLLAIALTPFLFEKRNCDPEHCPGHCRGCFSNFPATQFATRSVAIWRHSSAARVSVVTTCGHLSGHGHDERAWAVHQPQNRSQ